MRAAGGTAADPALLSRVPARRAGTGGPFGKSPPPRHGRRAACAAVSRMAGTVGRLSRPVIHNGEGDLR